jgi:hypothetical protein
MKLRKWGLVGILGASMGMAAGCSSRRENVEERPVLLHPEPSAPLPVDDPAYRSKDLDPLRVRDGHEPLSTRGGPLERRRLSVDESEAIALPGEERSESDGPERREEAPASELIPVQIPPNEAPSRDADREEEEDTAKNR